MYGYVYESTCLVNGKKYIGQHKGEFNPKYKGSGKIVKLALKKYNKESQWQVRLIEECETADDLDKREEYWIAYYDAVKREDYYNVLKGGSKNSYIVTQETKDKISKSSKGKKYINNGKIEKRIDFKDLDKYLAEGWKLGYIKTRKRHLIYSKAQKERFKKPEERAKCASILNKKSIYKDDVEKFVNIEDLDKYLAEGWKLGKPSLSRKPYKMTKKRKAYFERLRRDGAWNRGISNTLTEEQKAYISKRTKEAMTDGVKARISKRTKEALVNKRDKMSKAAYNRFSDIEERAKQSERIKGSRWMYKDGISSQVHKDKIKQYINLGWKFGRIKKDK